ncbi:MAG: hypothetical protein K6G62_03475 [Eubacterium sp.]|nr:hypothetical protein [Eubacterium sp.]
MRYIIYFIVIGFVLGAVITGVSLYRKIKRNVRDFSRQAFGTDDIKAGVRAMQEEVANTPKSVSGMTSLMLPKISRDFPDFNYDEAKSRTEAELISFLQALDENRPELMLEGTEEMRRQLSAQIQSNRDQGLRTRFQQVKIHRTEIHQYRNTAGRCVITFQTALECYSYVTDTKGKLVSGSRDYKYQTKFNTDLIYIQDRDLVEKETDAALGINCPNCGAPLKNLGAKHCEYCGSPVVELNIRTWNYSLIKEVK